MGRLQAMQYNVSVVEVRPILGERDFRLRVTGFISMTLCMKSIFTTSLDKTNVHSAMQSVCRALVLVRTYFEMSPKSRRENRKRRVPC